MNFQSDLKKRKIEKFWVLQNFSFRNYVIDNFVDFYNVQDLAKADKLCSNFFYLPPFWFQKKFSEFSQDKKKNFEKNNSEKVVSWKWKKSSLHFQIFRREKKSSK